MDRSKVMAIGMLVTAASHYNMLRRRVRRTLEAVREEAADRIKQMEEGGEPWMNPDLRPIAELHGCSQMLERMLSGTVVAAKELGGGEYYWYLYDGQPALALPTEVSEYDRNLIVTAANAFYGRSLTHEQR